MFRGMYRGSGQGGGGSVDYNRVVEKIAVIPSVETATVGKVYMYDGVSNANYTHGYIYECVATQTATAVSFSGNIVSNWAVADFVSYLQEGGSAYNEVTHGTLTYDESGGLWDLVGYDANGIQVMSFHEYTEDLEDFGCTFASATHQDGDSCNFTMTTEESGKKWKRLDVQPAGEGGGSGGDQHNLGWYATPEALRTAHATATAGDWAIVGSTDTVWVWDTDTSAWKDSDQKGQVASVNGQTGTVVLTASDVGAATAAQGTKADTAVQPADLATVATTGDYDDLTNKPTIPAAQVNSDWNANSGVAQILNKPTLGTMAAESASDYTKTANLATVATTGAYSDLSGTPSIPTKASDVDAVPQLSTLPTASVDNVGDIVQFVGTTTASYTNGYFYKCVSDGQDPATYSWTAVEVQASSGGSSYTAGTGIDITNDVISVTAPTLQNTATTAGYLSIYGNNSGVGVGICGEVGSGNVGGIAIGGSTTNTSNQASASGSYGAIAIGRGASASGSGSVAIGRETKTYSEMSVALGYYAQVSGASYAIQLGYGTNSTANTFSVGLGTNNNYRLLDSNGTIPAARHAALPSTDGTYVLKLVIASGVPTLSWVAE